MCKIYRINYSTTAITTTTTATSTTTTTTTNSCCKQSTARCFFQHACDFHLKSSDSHIYIYNIYTYAYILYILWSNQRSNLDSSCSSCPRSSANCIDFDIYGPTHTHTHTLTHVHGILNSRFEFVCPPGLTVARCVYVICAGNKQMEL